MKSVPLLFMFLTLSGCGTNFAELGQAPSMSPVGQGLQADARAIPVERRGRFTPGYQSVGMNAGIFTATHARRGSGIP